MKVLKTKKMDITKTSNTDYTFAFHDANSTLGYLLQTELLKNPDVIFAGYSCPHPLETKMLISIITDNKSPKEVMICTINKLVSKLNNIENVFKDTFKDTTNQ